MVLANKMEHCSSDLALPPAKTKVMSATGHGQVDCNRKSFVDLSKTGPQTPDMSVLLGGHYSVKLGTVNFSTTNRSGKYLALTFCRNDGRVSTKKPVEMSLPARSLSAVSTALSSISKRKLQPVTLEDVLISPDRFRLDPSKDHYTLEGCNMISAPKVQYKLDEHYFLASETVQLGKIAFDAISITKIPNLNEKRKKFTLSIPFKYFENLKLAMDLFTELTDTAREEEM